MRRLIRITTPLALLAMAQVGLLANGSMLGCKYTPPGDELPDAEDDPNFYACHCRCTAPATTTVRISSAIDDAEQQPRRGDDTDGADDLDIGVVYTGLRFAGVVIPPKAKINSAALQLTADQAFAGNNTTPLNLDVYAEAADDAPSFGASFANLTPLSRSNASIGWQVPAWTVGQSGAAQRSPDLKNVIQEIVDRPGWVSGNALAIFLAGGGGRREAESYDGDPTKAAVLEINYSAGIDQTLEVCMPASLNPNEQTNGMDNPVPSDMALQNDCAGRVETTLSHMAQACDYPSQCECDAEAGSRRFNVSCNDPCTEVLLNAQCSNFDPVGGATTATNQSGDTPVCTASQNAAHIGPSPMSASIFGQVSDCAVAGPATITVGDEIKETTARGVVQFLGRPCPGGQCSLGLSYLLDLDKITFQVRFASDPVFEDLASSGALVGRAATVGTMGLGTVDTGMSASTVRGRRSSTTRAYLLTNPDEVGVFTGWEDHTCALFGTVVSTVDGETMGDEELSAELSVSGDILNQPPHADAGPDRNVECTSPAGATLLLDGSGSSDPDDNLAFLTWYANRPGGPKIASGATARLSQSLGVPVTYFLRAIDELGQTDEDSTKVAILDRTAPALTLSVSPVQLLKLSPSLVTVKAKLTSSDVCDTNPAIRLRSITTNEGDLADATHSNPDIQGAAFGTDDREFQLRATHRVPNKGRIYTITYDVTDGSGNATTRTATVAAPYFYRLPYNPPVR